MKRKRLKPEARKEEIIEAALTIAENSHYLKVTRDQIARKIGISGAAVQYHFHTMSQLRVQMLRTAVKQERLAVVAQGCIAKDPHALRASDGLRRRAIDAAVGLW